MAKILFLDDCKMRHEMVDLFHGETNDITHVWSVEECVDKLSADKGWDVVSLDNDLGWNMEEGRKVAFWLEQNPQFIPPQVLIHSNNPVAAESMVAAIPKAVIATWWNKPACVNN